MAVERRLTIGTEMTDLLRCQRCKGTKTILLMGALRKECPECNGIGWVEPFDEEISVDDLHNVDGTPVVAKKRGRKAKIITREMDV